MREKVFERFFRVPNQDQAGSGLGLAIAEHAAARNRARVSLHGREAGTEVVARVAFCT
jgi:two-component system sensor histidine kinase QseC